MTDPKREVRIRRTVPYRGRILDLFVDEVRLPQGGTSLREVVRHRRAVAIVPLPAKEKVIFVRQFRYAQQRCLLEIPAGIVNRGETPERAAKRELAEETGYAAKRWLDLGQYFSSPGFTTEIIHIYLAWDLKPAPGAAPDADENLTHCALSFSAVKTMIRRKQIQDAKTVLALVLAIPGLAPTLAAGVGF